MMRVKTLASLVTVAALAACATDAQAQYVTYYQPSVYRPTVTYYAPAYAPAPVVAPAAYAVASPVVYEPAPLPAPTPVPVVTYYRAPAVTYVPTPQVVTRWRPILGGTVSRVRYGYAPVVY